MRLVHIAHRDDVAETRRVLRVPLSHSAATDERNTGTIIRTDDPPGRLVCLQFALHEPQRQPRRTGDHRAMREERTSSDLKWFVHARFPIGLYCPGLASRDSCAYTFAQEFFKPSSPRAPATRRESRRNAYSAPDFFDWITSDPILC